MPMEGFEPSMAGCLIKDSEIELHLTDVLGLKLADL